MTTILGVDPGLAKTGYGVIRVEGNRIAHIFHDTISTDPAAITGVRLETIYDGIKKAVETFQPSMAGIESIYFAKNISSALPVAQARGVILLGLSQENILTREFSPQMIKQMITGNGRAEKAQVQRLVRFLLSMDEPPGSDHASDALAAAICCYNSSTAESKIGSFAAKHDK
ncbi:MAG: crossover junction endodeoxyribonuclease RuvC [Spirochaetales bacterium]|nr:crossover junction endodeoxyribonuclease RuvC [Spirochaetales bacterium]